nr:putative reverse transcriptase domain-containing protein [Tanacetum cinerariifolium]
MVVEMDWLSKLRAKIVCYEKIFQILLSNGEILKVHGERPEQNLKQLKSKKVGEQKLKDIPVVHDFPGVFPKELSSLPPSRVVDFHIDLIPGAMPVAKSPYRLAPTEMQEFENWKPPKIPTEILLFLGLAGYYKRFMVNFSKIAKPLTLLTQKNKKFKWGDEQEIAFQTLKDMLCDALILALPEGTYDFVVYCDASNQGKANVVADVLSRKDRLKPRRARAMSMTIHSSIKAMILEAQSEISKGVLVHGDIRTLIINEAHATRTPEPIGITLAARDSRIEIREYFNGIHNQITKNQKRTRLNLGHYRSTKYVHFLAVREDFKTKRLARLYINEIVAITTKSLRNETGSKYSLSSQNRWPKYHSSVKCAPFVALYGRKYQTPIAWAEVGESKIIGPKVIQETTDKIFQIKERLKTARDRQKRYADNRQKPLEFSVGDKVLLKVSPRKGVVRFGKRSKLSPRYVGPFEIVKRVGPVAYRLRLPQELVGVDDTFHVSNLKKCLADENLHVPLEEVKIDDKLHFVKEPMEIMNREVKKLKKRRIPIVKVRSNSRRGPKFTWEREDEMKRKYPQLFASTMD